MQLVRAVGLLLQGVQLQIVYITKCNDTTLSRQVMVFRNVIAGHFHNYAVAGDHHPIAICYYEYVVRPLIHNQPNMERVAHKLEDNIKIACQFILSTSIL